jgi:sugar lactone lactonase YvrE
MRRVLVLIVVIAGAAAIVALDAAVGKSPKAGEDATWTTVLKSPFVLEGLTAGDDGNLYTALRNTAPSPCQVVRVSPKNTDATGGYTVVGLVSQPCSPNGLTFGPDGALYVAGAGPQRDMIVRVVPDATSPGIATPYATHVPTPNGLVFDRDGNLWSTDGGNGAGIVYRTAPGGGGGVEVFRVPALVNGLGVGRSAGTVPGGPWTIVGNGILFTRDGDMLIADTARGAVWHVALDARGNVTSPQGCDSTYPVDTLCLDNVFVQHPHLEGLDGIILDASGLIWGAANERNAIVTVKKNGSVEEFFRNPVAATGLRNAGPLETPTSPVVLGHTLCVAQTDAARRDNNPNTAGEVANGGKISCLDQPIEP